MSHKHVTNDNHSNSKAKFDTQETANQPKRNSIFENIICTNEGSIVCFACRFKKRTRTVKHKLTDLIRK